MADELVIQAKIPEGADEVLIRIPYERGFTRDDLTLFAPTDVAVDYRQDRGVWTPAELCGTDMVRRFIQ